MQTDPTTISELYDIPECRRLLIERRQSWASESGVRGYDHHGRMPLGGLTKPAIQSDPGKAGRSALHIARQYALLLEASPVVVEAWDPLPGAFAFDLGSLLRSFWPPDWLDAGLAARLRESHASVNVGMAGHFVPDLAIGMDQGWGGIASRVEEARARASGGQASEYLAALALVVDSCRRFISRHAEAARARAVECSARESAALLTLAVQIDAVESAPPSTTWQALVWISFFICLNRLYNFQNTIGGLDQMLGPFYEADRAAGIIGHEEARFLLESLLVHDTHFICIGGTDSSGHDASNRVSRLVLEAWHEVLGPANIGLRWNEGCPRDLLELAESCLLETGQGTPTLLNDAPVVSGLLQHGIPVKLARMWSYGGCHW